MGAGHSASGETLLPFSITKRTCVVGREEKHKAAILQFIGRAEAVSTDASLYDSETFQPGSTIWSLSMKRSEGQGLRHQKAKAIPSSTVLSTRFTYVNTRNVRVGSGMICGRTTVKQSMKGQRWYECGDLDGMKWLCLRRERLVNIKSQKTAVMSQTLVQPCG